MLTFVLLWLAVMLFPTLAVVLARNGQIQLGDSDGRHWRLFLLQELNTNVIPAKKNKINDLAAFTIFDFAVPATNVLLIALAELVVFFMLFVL